MKAFVGEFDRAGFRQLDRNVTIRMTPHKLGEPYQEVGFSA